MLHRKRVNRCSCSLGAISRSKLSKGCNDNGLLLTGRLSFNRLTRESINKCVCRTSVLIISYERSVSDSPDKSTLVGNRLSSIVLTSRTVDGLAISSARQKFRTDRCFFSQ